MGDFGPPVPIPETEVIGLASSSLTDPEEVSVLVTGFGVSLSVLCLTYVSLTVLASDSALKC